MIANLPVALVLLFVEDRPTAFGTVTGRLLAQIRRPVPRQFLTNADECLLLLLEQTEEPTEESHGLTFTTGATERGKSG